MNLTVKVYTTIFVLCLVISSTCNAIGYWDYELDIGDGYSIVKCNDLDIVVCNKNQIVILGPMDYSDVGPVANYYTTKQFIFTKNLGRKKRNLFQGDLFENIDPSKIFYFILSKGDDKVIGPLSEIDFKNHPNVTSTGSIRWRKPHNPRMQIPLYISIIGCCIAIAAGIILTAIKLNIRRRIVKTIQHHPAGNRT